MIKSVSKLYEQVYPHLVWALLLLGTSELSLILFQPVYSLLVMATCSCFYMSYLIFVHTEKKRYPKILKPILFVCILFVIAKLVYLYSVLLAVTLSLLLFNFLSLLVFIISGAIYGLLTKRFR